MTVSLCVIASPAGRTFAQRCVTACVDGSGRIGELLWNRTASTMMSGASLIQFGDRASAPDFALPTRSDSRISISREKGRVVLLNFWATWCPPCVAETQSFIELQRTLGARGLSIIGVSLDEDGWTSVDGFATRQHVNYPLVIGDDAITKAYSVTNLPTTILVDRSGSIAAVHVGIVDRLILTRELQQLLDEPTR